MENASAAFGAKSDTDDFDKDRHAIYRKKRRFRDGRGFLQAGIQAVGDTYTRKALIFPTEVTVGKDGKRHRYPSKARQCKPPGVARSTSYYKRKEGESQRNLKMIDLRDKQYDRCAAMGVRQMVDYLKREGYHVGKKLVRRQMALMGLRAAYPLKSLSKGSWAKHRMPSLMSLAVI